MFTLTRREGEAIVLPSLGITVRILEVRGNSIRFAVETPSSMRVARSEVLEHLALALARQELTQAVGSQ